MATSESTEKVLTGPIKIYKDKVVISNLTLSEDGEVNGIDASQIGAATVNQLNSLSTTVNNNYSTLNNKFSNYLPLSGGTLSGNILIQGDYETAIGCYFQPEKMLYLHGDCSSGSRGLYDTTYGTVISVTDNSNIFNGNATSSSSCSGNAATATKLNTNAGSATKPVYFSDGIPKECNTSLEVSITGSSGSCTGNANSATKVGKALTINSTSYDGSAAVTITVPTFSYNSTTKTLTITG